MEITSLTKWSFSMYEEKRSLQKLLLFSPHVQQPKEGTVWFLSFLTASCALHHASTFTYPYEHLYPYLPFRNGLHVFVFQYSLPAIWNLSLAGEYNSVSGLLYGCGLIARLVSAEVLFIAGHCLPSWLSFCPLTLMGLVSSSCWLCWKYWVFSVKCLHLLMFASVAGNLFASTVRGSEGTQFGDCWSSVAEFL